VKRGGEGGNRKKFIEISYKRKYLQAEREQTTSRYRTGARGHK